MAQEINILELDIDIDALTKKASEVRKNLLEISSEISQLKKDFKEGNISVNEYAENLTILTAVQKHNQKELRVYDTMLRANIGSDKSKIEQNKILTGSINEIGSALSQNKQAYQNLTEAERENAKIGGELLKIINEQDKKYKDLQKSIGNNQVQVGSYREEVKKALEEHYGLDAQVNKLSDSLGIFKTATLSAWGSLKSFVAGNQEAVNSIRDTETGVLKVSKVKALWIKTTNGTSLALKVLRGALLSTGIGAIVVLLGSLISYLTSTQEGINKVNSVLTPLKEIMATLWGVVQNVGKAFFDAFSKTSVIKDFGNTIKNVILLPLNQAIGVVKSLGKVLQGDLKGAWKEVSSPIKESIESVNKLTKSGTQATQSIANGFKGVGQAMNEAWERGKEIYELEKQLSEMDITYDAQQKKLNREYQEQLEISEDITKTQAERLKALDQAQKKQAELNALVTKHKELEVLILEKKAEANDTSNQDKKAISDKKAEIDDQNTQTIQQERLLQKKRNALNKEITEQTKKRIEANIEEQKKAIEYYVQTNSAVAQSLQERLNIEEKAKTERLAILEKEYIIGKINKQEYERQKNNIENDYLKTRAELSIEASQRELELYQNTNKSKIDKETELTIEIIEQEKLRLTNIYNQKVNALEQEKQLKQQARDWDYNAEAEHQAQLKQLKEDFDAEYNQTSTELNNAFDKQLSDKRKEEQELDFAERLLNLKEQGASEFDIKLEEIAQKYEAETNALDEQLANGKIKQEQYNLQLRQLKHEQAEAEKEIHRQKEEAILQATAGALGEAKKIFGEHTALGKATAIAEATINTYLGVTKAISTLPPPASFITAGTTLAMGLQNVQKIASTNTKFQKGGLVKGRSHEQGGIPFSVQGVGGYEMEGGEYIVNKNATSKYFPLLETLNNQTRYNPLHFRSGGLVHNITHSSAKIDMTELVNAVREGAMLGTFDGAKSGSEQGTKSGSLQGALEGTMIGTNTGLSERSTKFNHYNNSTKVSVI